MFFFFNDTATTEIYTLSLHDALPIRAGAATRRRCAMLAVPGEPSKSMTFAVLVDDLGRPASTPLTLKYALRRRTSSHPVGGCEIGGSPARDHSSKSQAPSRARRSESPSCILCC